MSKQAGSTSIQLPECQVCMETMTIPIFLCQSGHSLCNSCTTRLTPPICPICRQGMTQMRNWSLEKVISEATMPCPNAAAGCVFKKKALEMEDHAKECIYRDMDCPLGVVFGRCSWKGKLVNVLDHFKDRHPPNCDATCDKDIDLFNISPRDDDRHVYLVPQAKLLFLLTFKIDTIQKMAYWTVQHIGSKNVARQHIYEIHVTSNQDNRRKAVFTEHCFNDAIKADEVFRQGKCAVLPLDSFVHFIKDKKLKFRFFIKRLPNPPKSGDGKDGGNGPQQGPKGPKFNGPGKGPGGPKGPHPKKNQNKA